MVGKNPPQVKQPRWHMLYFVLAAFDILTITISLAVSHKLMDLYMDSVVVNQQWAQRMASYSELGEQAMYVNAPGNDVFDTGDVKGKSAQFIEQHKIFNEKLQIVREDLKENVSPAHARALLVTLDTIEQAMNSMVRESERIFEHFEQGESTRAGERMATMDRKYAIVTSGIARIGGQVRVLQYKAFARQVEAAESLRKFEYLIAVCIVIIVLSVTIYGNKVSQRIKTTNRIMQEQMVAIQKASKQANASSLAKDALLANMSHEIRTPMTAILGYCELMLDPEITESERDYSIHVVRRNGQHLLNLINDILDFSKIEAGKVEVEKVPVSPCDILNDVMDLFGGEAAETGIQLTIEVPDSIPDRVLSDPTRLKQMLLNLVGNASKFTDKGSIRVVASCDKATELLKLEVIDTGIGIPPAQLSSLFLPFKQGDPSMNRRFGGTGLGLTITRQIALMLGGDVTVTSVVGQGSKFTLTVATGSLEGVDMVDASITNLDRPTPIMINDELPTIKGRVLVVEDGNDNQCLIEHILRKAGAYVYVVENGAAGVDAAMTDLQRGNPFDIILMDMQMPIMDGYDATALLREKGYSGTIIALTAHAIKGEKEKCLEAGCDHYLSKPIDRAELIREIANHIQESSTLAT